MALSATAAQVIPVLLLVLAVEYRAFSRLRSVGAVRFGQVVFWYACGAEMIALLNLAYDSELYVTKLVLLTAVGGLLGLIGAFVVPTRTRLTDDRGD